MRAILVLVVLSFGFSSFANDKRFLEGIDKAIKADDFSSAALIFERIFRNHPSEEMKKSAASKLLDGLLSTPTSDKSVKFRGAADNSYSSVSSHAQSLIKSGFKPTDSAKTLKTLADNKRLEDFLAVADSSYPEGIPEEVVSKLSLGAEGQSWERWAPALAQHGHLGALRHLLENRPNVYQFSTEGPWPRSVLRGLLESQGSRMKAADLEEWISLGVKVNDPSEVSITGKVWRTQRDSVINSASLPSQIEVLERHGIKDELQSNWRGNVEVWSKDPKESQIFEKLVQKGPLARLANYEPQDGSDKETMFLRQLKKARVLSETKPRDLFDKVMLKFIPLTEDCNIARAAEVGYIELMKEAYAASPLPINMFEPITGHSPNESRIRLLVNSLFNNCKEQPSAALTDILEFTLDAAKIDSDEKQSEMQKLQGQLEAFRNNLNFAHHKVDRFDSLIRRVRKKTLIYDNKGRIMDDKDIERLLDLNVKAEPHRKGLNGRRRFDDHT